MEPERGGGRPHTPRPRAPRRRLRLGLQGKSSGKTLPKIEEGLVAKANPSSSESCSHPGKVPGRVDLEIKEEKIEGSSKLWQESVTNFSEIQGRLQDTEATSSSDVTLPTGVSTYVLQCLDSIIDHSTCVIDSPSSCLSPETFRDDDDDQVSIVCAEDSGKYKNSTFLDPSNAVSIDRMPQALNLSAIPEPVLEDFQVRYPGRKRASKPSYSSSQLSASTTLAGKEVHKITTARKRSPDLEAGTHCSSPLGLKRKPDSETVKPIGLKRKKKEKHLEGQSSSLVPGAPGSSLAESEGLAAEMPSFKRRSAVEQMSPNRPVEEENKALKSPGSTQPSKLDLQCSRFPICSIIGSSPRQRSSVTKIPVRSQAPRLPEGFPEDIITSAKIWANYKCQ